MLDARSYYKSSPHDWLMVFSQFRRHKKNQLIDSVSPFVEISRRKSICQASRRSRNTGTHIPYNVTIPTEMTETLSEISMEDSCYSGSSSLEGFLDAFSTQEIRSQPKRKDDSSTKCTHDMQYRKTSATWGITMVSLEEDDWPSDESGVTDRLEQLKQRLTFCAKKNTRDDQEEALDATPEWRDFAQF